MPMFEITVKSYPEEAKALMELWNNYVNLQKRGLGMEDEIFFTNKAPKNPKSNNRRIAGIPAECVSYLRDNTEYVKMTVENFTYLMAKCGVKMEIAALPEVDT